MFITTTEKIDDIDILEYYGPVFGEIYAGISWGKDVFINVRNVFGGRSQTFENEIIKVREQVIQECVDRAKRLGANAIIDFHVDYKPLFDGHSSMLLITCYGTAVKVEEL